MAYTSQEPFGRAHANSSLIQRVRANNDGSEIFLALTWTNYMLVETRWILSEICTTYNIRWQLQILLDTKLETLKLVLYFPCNNMFYLDTRFHLRVYEDEATSLYLKDIHHTGTLRDFFTVTDLPLNPILPLLRNRTSVTKLIFKFHFTHLFQFSSTKIDPKPALALFLNHKPTSDCCIEVEKELIYVHRLWLSEQSTFFKAMFQSNFREANLPCIPFKEWKLTSFLCCLIHMYLGWLPHEEVSEKAFASFPILQSSTFPPKDMTSWMDIGSLARMLGLSRFAYYAFQHAHDMLSEELTHTKHELMNDMYTFEENST